MQNRPTKLKPKTKALEKIIFGSENARSNDEVRLPEREKERVRVSPPWWVDGPWIAGKNARFFNSSLSLFFCSAVSGRVRAVPGIKNQIFLAGCIFDTFVSVSDRAVYVSDTGTLPILPCPCIYIYRKICIVACFLGL